MNKIVVCLLLIALLILSAGGGVSGTSSSPYNVSSIYPLLSSDGKIVDGGFPSLGSNNIVFTTGVQVNNSSESSSAIIMVNISDTHNSKQSTLYINNSIDWFFSGPKTSRDESKIVFTTSWVWGSGSERVGGGGLDLLVRNTTSRNETYDHIILLNLTGAFIWYPSFSWDGTKIVYNSNEGGGFVVNDVWVINANGTNRTRLTYDNKGGANPCLSPDDKKIVYMPYGPSNNYELWIMDADGTNKTRLLDESWGVHDVSFTPAGQVLYTSSRMSPHSNKGGAGNIWLMNADGSNKTFIIPENFPSEYATGALNTAPSMSPDQKMILFRHGITTFGLYYVTDPTGQWKDSDGDGVWDGIDGAPNDPGAGYITGDDITNPLSGLCGASIIVPVLAVSSVMVVIAKKRKIA